MFCFFKSPFTTAAVQLNTGIVLNIQNNHKEGFDNRDGTGSEPAPTPSVTQTNSTEEITMTSEFYKHDDVNWRTTVAAADARPCPGAVRDAATRRVRTQTAWRLIGSDP